MGADKRYRIALVGDSCTGKTSFFRRYTNALFEEEYSSTKCIEHYYLNINTNVGELHLELLDIPGLYDVHIPAIDAAFIFFDRNKYRSSKSVYLWYTKVKQSNPSAHIIIVGNKSDLVENNSTTYIDEFINLKLPYFEISCKTGYNIQLVMQHVLSDLSKEPNLVIDLSDKKRKVLKLIDNVLDIINELKTLHLQ